MKIFKYLLPLILIFSLFCSAHASEMPEEMPVRGVWVATVYQINYPETYTKSEDELKAWADEILDNAKELGFNTVFLQVRPSSDAFYKSEYFPWSKYITGTQGVAPENNFDPLEYWVEAAHERGLSLHAWINPYRVAVSESDYNSMSVYHPAKLNTDWVVKHTNGQYYFNPGIPEVRELIKNGVAEIVNNYDIDGVHLDDYFYPSEDFADSDTFEKYRGSFTDLGDWRRNNVDVLIEDLSTIVKYSGKSFGVSPAGIWANKGRNSKGSLTSGNQTYYSSFADTRKWVKNEWLDYIVPQIYWNIGYDIADYEVLVNWWADVVSGTDVELYIGMADYRVVSDNPDSVWYGDAEMRRQLELNRTIPQITGEVHYNYASVVENPYLCDLYSEVYAGNEPQKAPEIEWQTHTAYIEGTAGAFMPEGELTRAQAAMLFARIMGELGEEEFDKNAKYATDFSDVKGNEWFASAVGFVQKKGLISGYPDGTFLPNKTITRAEFATMISRLDELSLSDKTFPDVAENHWAYKYIQNAYARGLISGYPDGTFAPEKTITRAETTKILNAMLHRVPNTRAIDEHDEFNIFSDVTKSHWAYYQIIEASFTHEFTFVAGDEIWNTGNTDFIGENGFVYASNDFDFEVINLRLTARLTPLNLKNVDSIALHHMEHPTATFRDVERWHIDDNGWRAIGYNFWIGFDGTIYVGRGLNVGAGVGSNNDHIISIGFQGDYDGSGATMPKEQYDSAIALINWLSRRVETITMIGGHGAWNSTDCPGDEFPLEEICEASGLEFVPQKEG